MTRDDHSRIPKRTATAEFGVSLDDGNIVPAPSKKKSRANSDDTRATDYDSLGHGSCRMPHRKGSFACR